MIDYRLDLCQQSQFNTLLQMCLRCQKGRRPPSQPTSTDDDCANIFARTIRDGNVNGSYVCSYSEKRQTFGTILIYKWQV